MQLSVAITPAIALAAGDAVSAPLIGASGLAFLGVLLLGADGAADSSFLSAIQTGFGTGDILCLLGAVCWSMQLFRLGRLARLQLPAIQLQAAKTALVAPYGAWVLADVLAGNVDVA